MIRRVLVYRVDKTSPGTYLLGIGWIRGTIDLHLIWLRVMLQLWEEPVRCHKKFRIG